MSKTGVFAGTMAISRRTGAALAIAMVVGVLFGAASVAMAATPSGPTTANTATSEATTYYKAVDEWGSFGTANGQFREPRDVATGPEGNVYVVDSRNHRVQKFSPDGTFLGKWGSDFSLPHGIAVAPSGNVYVTDLGNNHIQKFSPDGTLLDEWGSFGTGPGQFDSPWGIAVAPSGNVYVTDLGNNRIQKFAPDGTFLDEWGSEGPEDGQFQYPIDVAVGVGGNVYVADGRRVQKFSPDGTFLGKWGSYGMDPGQFEAPQSVAIDHEGNVYVAEGIRVQKFSPDGTFLSKWGSYGTDPGQFDGAMGIATDADGYVYVVEYWNARIQKFAEVPLSTDTAPAVTRASCDRLGCRSNRDITVTLEATDIEGPGGKQITYEASGVQQIAPTTVAGEHTHLTISASAVGETTITFYSTDLAGNVESPKSRTVTIDKTPPRVKSTTPQNLTTGVRPGAPIEAIFSEPIRTHPLIKFGYMSLYKKGSSVPVGAQLTYDKQTKKATLVPDAPLKRGATYRAEVSIYNVDLAGNNLDQRRNVEGYQQKVWYFTVAN